jgi:two-component system CheB/CheR fusion protein
MSQAQIIDDLLDISRVRTGKLSIVRTAVDMREIVQRVAGAVQSEATQRGVALGVSITDEPVVVHADITRIEQIVWNLLSNALKYTAHGSIDVSLRLDAGNAVLRVADTGMGIDPEQLPHIFNMYQQTRNTAGRRTGLGIGLTLVRELVNLHGGAVQAESEGLGRGASFTVTLPTHRPLFHVTSGSPEHAHASLNGVRVMMVDDDAATVDTFKLLLESEGALVRTATSGEDALSMLVEGEAPDMILSDLGMPGMDGFELVDEVRKKQGLKHVICIALSGFGHDADVARAKQAGFDAHLKKPVMLDDLLAAFAALRGTSEAA